MCVPETQCFCQESSVAAIGQVLRGAGNSADGKYLAAFERDFGELVGAKRVFGVSTGANALKLAAIFCHIHPGDEVIVPAFGGRASAISFGDLGATIVWGDIHSETWTLDPEDVLRKITPKTKAVIAVHPHGIPCDIRRLVQLAHTQGVLVVEDCGAALGGYVDGQHIGTHGDFGCFRFDSEASCAALGGTGVLICRDEETAKHVPAMRSASGLQADASQEDAAVVLEDRWPQDFLLGEVQSAFGSERMKCSSVRGQRWTELDRRLREELAVFPEITFPQQMAGIVGAPRRCLLSYEGSACGTTREDLLALLKERHHLHATPLLSPDYRSALFQRKGSGYGECPALERWLPHAFALLWRVDIDEDGIRFLCEAVGSAVMELRNGVLVGAGSPQRGEE